MLSLRLIRAVAYVATFIKYIYFIVIKVCILQIIPESNAMGYFQINYVSSNTSPS